MPRFVLWIKYPKAGDHLPDGTVVIRAGENSPAQLLANANSHVDKGHDHYALSCNAVPGLSAARLAKRVRYPNGKITPSTTDRIRKLGYDPVPDGKPYGHSNIRLRTPLTDNRLADQGPLVEELRVLATAFKQPIPNPGRNKRKGKRR